MNIIQPNQLKQHRLSVGVIDTYLSGWTPTDSFDKFKKTERPFSALVFLTGDVECVYVEIDRAGREIRRILCKKGDILYIPKNVMYYALFECKTPKEEASTCTVNFDLYDGLGQEVILDEHIIMLPNKVNHFMYDDLINIYRCTRNPLNFDQLRIHALYFSILYYATRMDDEKKQTKAIKRVVRRLEEEWDRNVPMEAYAALCNMSLTYFYREFKSYTGQSPTKFRNQIRIHAAKSYMNNTDMTIREIAERVGFSDEFYFSRIFKKMTGSSPSRFKQE